MVQDLQQVHDDVQHMIEELQEASVHLERALFARNRLAQWLSNHKINQEFNEELKPPEVVGEGR